MSFDRPGQLRVALHQPGLLQRAVEDLHHRRALHRAAAAARARPRPPAQPPDARPHVLPGLDAHAVRDVGGRGHAGVRPAVQPGRGPDQLAARPGPGSTPSTGATATGRRRSPSPSIIIWRWTGYNALIYLAGMQSIPHDLYEAAAMDGANALAAVPARHAARAAAHDPVHHRGLHDRRLPGLRRAADLRRRRGRRGRAGPVPDPGPVPLPAGLADRAARPGRRRGLGDVPDDRACWCW